MTAIPETFQDLFHKCRRFGWRNDATRVSLDLVDPDNPYRHLSIRGQVVAIPKKGADDQHRQTDEEIPQLRQSPPSQTGRSTGDL
jgi:hypothetical protein